MGRLSFAIALNLITDNFKKGVNTVKSGFSSMQAKIITFSTALDLVKNAFSSFAAQSLSIVRDTNRASTALKNVSGSAAELVGNQKFLVDLSKKYGANVNDLSTSYAKFTASAKLAGMPLSVQKSLFESVSRATAAFALSSEDTNSVFLALSQMMGKGKIQAQELRLQMGEKLPIALQAMAKAAGVSVGQLDKMMQKGELISGEVLPKFGKALDELIPNVDTNHLETSVNRLQNAKIELLKSTPVSDTYKLFIDTLTEAVSGLTSALNSTGAQKFFAKFKTAVIDFVTFLKNNAGSLVTKIVGLFAGIKISKFFTQFKAFSKASDDAMVTNATVAHAKVRMLENGTTRLKRQIATEEVSIEKLSGDERLAAEVQLTSKKKQLAANEVALTKAKNTARVADERAAAVQSGNAWEATWAKIKTGATSLATSLKAVWATVGPMILITLVTELIAKFVEWKSKADSIRNSFRDYRNEAGKAVHTREIVELEELKQQYDHAKVNSRERLDLEKRIGEVTGQHVTGEKNINKLLTQRISLLQAAAAVEYYTTKTLTLQDRQDELKQKYGGKVPGSKANEEQLYTLLKRSIIGSVLLNPVAIIKLVKGVFKGAELANDINEFAANTKMLSDAHRKLASAETRAGKIVEDPYNPTSDGDKKKKKKKADKAQEELDNAKTQYTDSLMKIALSEKVGLKTSDQANKARKELIVSTYSELATSKYPKVRASAFTQKLGSEYRQIEANKPLDDLNTIAGDYYKKLDDLKKQFSSGAITQNEYAQSISDLIAETRKSMSLLPDMTGKSKKYVDSLFDLSSSMSSTRNSLVQKLPAEEQRDTTLDYKKTNTDILSEQLDKAKKRLDDLKSMAVQSTGQMVDAINDQLSKVTSLSDALKLAEVKKDAEDFSKDLKEKTWDGIRDIADGSDRILSSWQQLGQTLSSTDASGWEKIMAIWQALEDSVDSIFNIINAIGEWTKASDDLTHAKEKEKILVSAANAKESASSKELTGTSIAESAAKTAACETTGVAKMTESGIVTGANAKESASNITVAGTAETAASATTAAAAAKAAATVTGSAVSTAASELEASENRKTVAGNVAAAGSEVIKQNAKIPFVGIALAAAGLIAILGLFGKLPKFAFGGIVGGSSTSGDNMLARVNSGEMILNGSQQKKLFNVINAGGAAGAQQSIVSTKVRGEDMYLTIRNYMKSKNKSW